MANREIIRAAGRLGRVVAFRLRPGADVLRSFETLAREENITSGVVVSGAASLRRAVLRNPKGFTETFPLNDTQREFTELEGPLEMLAVGGNFSHDASGAITVHLHATVSRSDGAAFGGHMVEGSIIYTTGEFAVAEVEGMRLTRAPEDGDGPLIFYPVGG